jgi:hypothetical protein
MSSFFLAVYRFIYEHIVRRLVFRSTAQEAHHRMLRLLAWLDGSPLLCRLLALTQKTVSTPQRVLVGGVTLPSCPAAGRPGARASGDAAMKLDDIVQRLSLTVHTPANNLNVEISGGYACDLLSHVMAKGKAGSLWITVQGHPNMVAVASLIGLAGVIVAEGAKIEPAAIEKAEQEGVPLLASALTTYEVAGKLWELGVR